MGAVIKALKSAKDDIDIENGVDFRELTASTVSTYDHRTDAERTSDALRKANEKLSNMTPEEAREWLHVNLPLHYPREEEKNSRRNSFEF